MIDFHTHIFPDKIAEKALSSLAANSSAYRPFTDATLHGLLCSMDSAGLQKSVIANIATKPEQANPILKWSLEIRSERIEPLGSIHPDSPHWSQELEAFAENGFKGIKLHPMYQNFDLTEKKMFPVYRKISELGLFILTHSGFDIAYPGNQKARPRKLRTVLDRCPDLTVIAAHWGGWQHWNEVSETILDTNVYLDTSFIEEVPAELLEKFKSRMTDRLLFGSDSPWLDQKQELQRLKAAFPDDLVKKILVENPKTLLQ